MNTSSNINQTHDSVVSARGLRHRKMVGVLLATAFTATAIGLAATGHADSGETTRLQSLIPTPANTQRTDGPTTMADNGIRMHFLVDGSGTAVLAAYKSALEGQGWTVTVESSGGYGGYGGATYTGTRGDAYGVFTGGGPGGFTDVSACAWPSKPGNTNCGDSERR